MVKLTKTLSLGSDEPIKITHEYGSIKMAQDDMKKESETILNAMTRQGHTVDISKDDKSVMLKISDVGTEKWVITE